MVAQANPTFTKTPRQMLASLAGDIERQIQDRRCDPRTVAEAARQYATMILAECDRQNNRGDYDS